MELLFSILKSLKPGLFKHWSAIKPLQPSIAFLYPLKISENLKVIECGFTLNDWVWIHSETRTWHYKNIQLETLHFVQCIAYTIDVHELRCESNFLNFLLLRGPLVFTAFDLLPSWHWYYLYCYPRLNFFFWKKETPGSTDCMISSSFPIYCNSGILSEFV